MGFARGAGMSTNRRKLYVGAGTMVSGLNKHENNLALMHAPAAVVDAALTASKAADQAHRTARTGLRSKQGEKKAAQANAREFVIAARTRLQSALGLEWSAAWVQAGFINNSLAVPNSAAKLLSMLGS